jgi:hypothetical protein
MFEVFSIHTLSQTRFGKVSVTKRQNERLIPVFKFVAFEIDLGCRVSPPDGPDWNKDDQGIRFMGIRRAILAFYPCGKHSFLTALLVLYIALLMKNENLAAFSG